MATPQNWTITAQQETTGLTETGTPAKGLNVTFRLDDGTVGTVFVPDTALTPASVAAAVQARATTLVGIKGLTGTVQGV